MKSNDELLVEFLDTYDTEGTKIVLRSDLQLFEQFIEKNFQNVTGLDLEQYFQYLNKHQDLKKNTKMKRFNSVRAFYNHFLYLQSIDKQNTLGLDFVDPMVEVRIKKRRWASDKTEEEKEILTIAEIKHLLTYLKTTKSYRNYMIFYFLADTGARVSEITQLELQKPQKKERYGYFNLEKRMIYSYNKGKVNKYVFGYNLQQELQQYLEVRPLIKSSYRDDSFLFISKHGGMLLPQTYTNKSYKHDLHEYILEKFGKHTTPHTLRRSWNTNRLDAGMIKEKRQSLLNQYSGLSKAYRHPTDKQRLNWFDEYELL